jgi:hypothetical protein
MMDTIAQRLLESVSWGTKLRLYLGAGLSTMDLITDLYMTYSYATTGFGGFAIGLGVMVGLNIFWNSLFIFVNKRKGPPRVMVKELLIVLSGLAPGIHAMRVANGEERSDYAKLDPEIELVYTRCFEMALESAPGSILQTYSMFASLKKGERLSKRALASILVSAFTTGFGAAVISFE